MKLIVSFQDSHGIVSAAMELPSDVALAPKNMVDCGDALMEVVIGSLQGTHESNEEPPTGFFINN